MMNERIRISETQFSNLVRGLKDPRFGDAEALYRFIFGPPSVRAIFFHLAKWMPKSRLADGSIHRSAAEIARDTGYSPGTVDHNRAALEAIGFDIKLRKANGTPTNHYALNPERFFAFMGEKLGRSPAEIRALMYPSRKTGR